MNKLSVKLFKNNQTLMKLKSEFTDKFNNLIYCYNQCCIIVITTKKCYSDHICNLLKDVYYLLKKLRFKKILQTVNQY